LLHNFKHSDGVNCLEDLNEIFTNIWDTATPTLNNSNLLWLLLIIITYIYMMFVIYYSNTSIYDYILTQHSTIIMQNYILPDNIQIFES